MTPENEARLLQTLTRIATALERISDNLGHRILSDEPDSVVSVCSVLGEIATHLESIDQHGIDTYPQN